MSASDGVIVRGPEGTPLILANIAYEWEPGTTYRMALQVVNRALQAWVNDRLLEVAELDGDLSGGGIALICTEGCMDAEEVAVEPVGAPYGGGL